MNLLLAQLQLDLNATLGKLFLPAMIILIAVAFIIVVKVMASRYKKIPPNRIGIFFGRKYKWTDPTDGKQKVRGFRIVAGGGSLLWPFFEDYQELSTAAFQTSIGEKNIPNKDNVKISVDGIATCKISTAPEDLHNAAMAFLGKEEDHINLFVNNILIGHLRSIIGKLDIDEILRQRDTFNRRVIEESTEELKRLGIQIITLVITDVGDEKGYINYLGEKTVAQARRDAGIQVAEAERERASKIAEAQKDQEIKIAEAKRDQDIKVAQAIAETQKRQSDAAKEASIVAANNAIAVAEAERDRDVKRAQFKVVADTETAKANQALAIQTAEQEKILKVRQAERDAAEREAQADVQRKEASRRQEELTATVIMQAEANRKRDVIQAEATAQVAEAERKRAIVQADAAVQVADAQRKRAVIEAEAAKSVTVLQAEAQSESTIRKAEGEKQSSIRLGEGEASMTLATMTAKAEGEAAIKRQALLAEAEGQAAMKGRVLLAEAEGTAKLADALAKMTDAAKLIMILDRLPKLIELAGDAGEKVARATFSGIAAPLGNIDSIHIVDMGGNGKGLDQMAPLVPNTVFKTLASLKASGIDVEGLAKKVGVDISAISKMIGQGVVSAQTTPPPAAPPAHETTTAV